MSRHIITPVVVLKAEAFSEIHKNLVLFSPELGIIRAMAHGAQKAKSKMRVFAQPFCRFTAYLYFNPVKKSYKLSDGENPRYLESIRLSLKKFYLASFMAEVIFRSFGGGENFDELYQLLDESLDVMETQAVPQLSYLTVQFLSRFLKLNGLMSPLAECENCHRTLEQRESLFYNNIEEAFVCESCSNMSVQEVTGGARKYIQNTMGKEIQQTMSFSLQLKTLEQLKSVLISRIQALIEGPLKTLNQEEKFI